MLKKRLNYILFLIIMARKIKIFKNPIIFLKVERYCTMHSCTTYIAKSWIINSFNLSFFLYGREQEALERK